MEKFISTPRHVAASKKASPRSAVISKVAFLNNVENQYLPGEECIAICEVDNYKCSTAISEVKVKFLKCVTLMSAFGEEKSFLEEINNISFAGTKAYTMYAGENAQRLILPLKYRSSDSPIHPSTSGRYVKC